MRADQLAQSSRRAERMSTNPLRWVAPKGLLVAREGGMAYAAHVVVSAIHEARRQSIPDLYPDVFAILFLPGYY
jgi:hypothetical protein